MASARNSLAHGMEAASGWSFYNRISLIAHILDTFQKAYSTPDHNNELTKGFVSALSTVRERMADLNHVLSSHSSSPSSILPWTDVDARLLEEETIVNHMCPLCLFSKAFPPWCTKATKNAVLEVATSPGLAPGLVFFESELVITRRPRPLGLTFVPPSTLQPTNTDLVAALEAISGQIPSQEELQIEEATRPGSFQDRVFDSLASLMCPTHRDLTTDRDDAALNRSVTRNRILENIEPKTHRPLFELDEKRAKECCPESGGLAEEDVLGRLASFVLWGEHLGFGVPRSAFAEFEVELKVDLGDDDWDGFGQREVIDPDLAFVGREDTVEEICQLALAASDGDAVVTRMVSGEMGMGKSTTVNHVLHALVGKYRGKGKRVVHIRIDGSRGETIKPQLERVAQNQGATMEELKAFLARPTTAWVLMVDDVRKVDVWTETVEIMQGCGGGLVVGTSSADPAQWETLVGGPQMGGVLDDIITLPPLKEQHTSEMASRMNLKRFMDECPGLWNDVAAFCRDTLKNLPLAVRLFLLRLRRSTPHPRRAESFDVAAAQTAVRNLLVDPAFVLDPMYGNQVDHLRGVMGTVRLAMQELDEVGKEMMGLLAVLGMDRAPRSFFEVEEDPVLAPEDVVSTIAQLGLVRQDVDEDGVRVFVVHGLVREAIMRWGWKNSYSFDEWGRYGQKWAVVWFHIVMLIIECDIREQYDEEYGEIYDEDALRGIGLCDAVIAGLRFRIGGGAGRVLLRARELRLKLLEAMGEEAAEEAAKESSLISDLEMFTEYWPDLDIADVEEALSARVLRSGSLKDLWLLVPSGSLDVLDYTTSLLDGEGGMDDDDISRRAEVLSLRAYVGQRTGHHLLALEAWDKLEELLANADENQVPHSVREGIEQKMESELYWRANILERMGRSYDALKVLQMAKTKKGEELDFRDRTRRGRQLAARGREEDAIVEFERILADLDERLVAEVGTDAWRFTWESAVFTELDLADCEAKRGNGFRAQVLYGDLVDELTGEVEEDRDSCEHYGLYLWHALYGSARCAMASGDEERARSICDQMGSMFSFVPRDTSQRLSESRMGRASSERKTTRVDVEHLMAEIRESL